MLPLSQFTLAVVGDVILNDVGAPTGFLHSFKVVFADVLLPTAPTAVTYHWRVFAVPRLLSEMLTEYVSAEELSERKCGRKNGNCYSLFTILWTNMNPEVLLIRQME